MPNIQMSHKKNESAHFLILTLFSPLTKKTQQFPNRTLQEKLSWNLNIAASSNLIKALHTDVPTHTRMHARTHTHTQTHKALCSSWDRLLVLCLMQYLIDPTQEASRSQMHSFPPPTEKAWAPAKYARSFPPPLSHNCTKCHFLL